MKTRVISLVTNDLSQDQRMNRICTALAENGYNVLLVGRYRKHSIPLREKKFHQRRIRNFFNTGFLFYAEHNFRLFLLLIRARFDVVNANDLDTLPAAFLAAKIKRKKLVYDAHEYFTEQEEVVHRKLVKSVWKWIERTMVPQSDAAYTVSKGYAELFKKEYHVDFSIVRNVTRLSDRTLDCDRTESYILYQGSVNHGRGLPQLIEAMKNLQYKLIICGIGDIYEDLKQLAIEYEVDHKVEFRGFVEPEDLPEITCKAQLGLTIFDKEGLSHYHSLANRFFDYIHAGIPQIAMDYPEYRKFNAEFEVAQLVASTSPGDLEKGIRSILEDDLLRSRLRNNALEARKKYNWQQNEKTLLDIYASLEG
jgi:glycosyltransferase involved in cell wall biosynthesis